MYKHPSVQGEIVFIKGSCCKKTQVVSLTALDTRIRPDLRAEVLT